MIAGAIKAIAGEMQDRNMAAAFDIMMDERKARLFVVMEEGEVRDIWLENQLQQSI
ncbi:hypothetical protein F441_09083 [Phytophthora nicotianae CJ01A1]|uniref:Uncharacterized protein n=1 Tax=Phytophthora nicotianae CJ01A1 TaxID=1317063 RepID=W2X183_PHYNI|nr:hypothetical protein F441_09083 [Phytophthora nicotianae CJ01A1]